MFSFRKSFWKNKQKQLKITEKKKQFKCLEDLKPEEDKEDIKSIEGLFPKKWDLMKLKMK